MFTVMFPTVRLASGGAEQQLLELVRGLDKQRFLPIVAPLYRGGALERAFNDVPGAEVVCLDRRNKYDPSVLWKLVGLLRARGVDVVQPFVNPASVFGLLAAILAGTPVKIATERSGVRRYRGFGARTYQQAENALLPYADVAVANSEAGCELLLQSGAPAASIRVIANGISPARVHADPDNVARHRRRLGAADGAPIVGILANLIPAKDHRTFLRAAATVRAEVPDARFAVVGEGPLRHELQLLAAHIGLTDRVTFFGFQSNVADFLELFDVLVSSSRDNEGHSNSILEAMAAGVPVVATDIGGNRELVHHPDTGLVVPVADHRALASAILAILHSPDLAEGLVTRGRAMIAERFTLDRMVRSYETLYEDLLRTKVGVRQQYAPRLESPRSAEPRVAHLSIHGH